MVEQITLYTAKICPWAHRAEITLEEAELPYKRYEIDLANKPVWYAPKVNPASKVPAISYGGPDVPPDQPSPDSQKIAESGVLIEFFADLSTIPLLPKDPVQRARARFFIETATPKVFSAYIKALKDGEDPAAFLEAIDILQGLLPKEGFAVGTWSIADAAVTPFLARAEVAFANDLGAYQSGKGTSTWTKLQQEPRYERFRKYFADIKGRDSFKKTFDTEVVKTVLATRFVRANA